MSELWTCAYCGEQHPRIFFWLRDSTTDPDPCCWGCSDKIERGELAPHYPDDVYDPPPGTGYYDDELAVMLGAL